MVSKTRETILLKMGLSQNPSSKHHHFFWQSREPEPCVAARAPLETSQAENGGVTWSFGKAEDISPACWLQGVKYMQGITGRPTAPLPPLPWSQSPLVPSSPVHTGVLGFAGPSFWEGIWAGPKAAPEWEQAAPPA